jgi:serine/threonine-protein kinase
MRYGRYEILKELGKGSMGMVFQAHDPQIDRLVAIKVLRQDRLSSDSFVQRFLKEAKTIGRLSHPNIVTVYDVGEDRGTIYIAMEFLEGDPLDKFQTPERKFTIREIADVGVQVAEALHYAHERGVIHRDIKPSNIIVQSGGRIKITDFGIAHIEDPSGAVQTQAGEILGTPAYMSPEQVLGETVDGRSDLFSLGVILWELSTGRRPFRGETMAAIFRVVTQENPEAPDKINAAVPSALSNIILKCLEKDPRKRYESGNKLADALKKIPGGGHETIHYAPAVSARPKPSRSLILGLAVMGVVAAGGLFYYVQNPKTTVQPVPPPVVEKVKVAFLRVESTPAGAQIFIDGNFKGKTPGRLEVTATKHEVRLVLAGYYDWEAQVEPPENSEFPLIVILTAANEKK